MGSGNAGECWMWPAVIVSTPLLGSRLRTFSWKLSDTSWPKICGSHSNPSAVVMPPAVLRSRTPNAKPMSGKNGIATPRPSTMRAASGSARLAVGMP